MTRCEASGQQTFIASKKSGSSPNSIGLVLEGSILHHGVIAETPSNLGELHDFALTANLDVIGCLKSALRKYKLENPFPATNEAYVLLLLRLPKSRYAGGPKEIHDLVGFISFEQAGALGEKLGLWSFHNGNMGMLLTEENNIRVKDVHLCPVRPQPAMSPAVGASLSGTTPRDFDGAFVESGHSVHTCSRIWYERGSDLGS